MATLFIPQPCTLTPRWRLTPPPRRRQTPRGSAPAAPRRYRRSLARRAALCSHTAAARTARLRRSSRRCARNSPAAVPAAALTPLQSRRPPCLVAQAGGAHVVAGGGSRQTAAATGGTRSPGQRALATAAQRCAPVCAAHQCFAFVTVAFSVCCVFDCAVTLFVTGCMRRVPWACNVSSAFIPAITLASRGARDVCRGHICSVRLTFMPAMTLLSRVHATFAVGICRVVQIRSVGIFRYVAYAVAT
eukprot:364588-Chlamydomonas_euryale.AAC.3